MQGRLIANVLTHRDRAFAVRAALPLGRQLAKVRQPLLGVGILKDTVAAQHGPVRRILDRLPWLLGRGPSRKAVIACPVVAQQGAALVLPVFDLLVVPVLLQPQTIPQAVPTVWGLPPDEAHAAAGPIRRGIVNHHALVIEHGVDRSDLLLHPQRKLTRRIHDQAARAGIPLAPGDVGETQRQEERSGAAKADMDPHREVHGAQVP